MLQIDMTEEPVDDDDRIFLATNKWVGDRYVLVTPEYEKAAKSAKSLINISLNIGQQLASAFNTAFAHVFKALREADEKQAREARLHGLEQLGIQEYDSDARLHKGGVKHEQ